MSIDVERDFLLEILAINKDSGNTRCPGIIRNVSRIPPRIISGRFVLFGKIQNILAAKLN